MNGVYGCVTPVEDRIDHPRMNSALSLAIVGLLIITVFSGCFGERMDIHAVNNSGSPIELSLNVTSIGQAPEVRFQAAENLADGEVKKWNGVVKDDGHYRIHLALDNGSEWTDEMEFSREEGPAGLHLSLSADRIDATYRRT